ncbi:Transposase, Ptta/En/Spm, plant [Corchorus olitorius]|uniref:Transposase, Ptta/En/Spm, plant n=1 Tax=Corchorus olitorius TaxID=93759 RepID=A0A1R3I3A9_9ROSI|nr:Transposase, Ptta/En/Spm, plant [Corchorus olitorius]
MELKYGKRCAEWLKNAMHRCLVKRKKPQWITRAIWKKLVELWDSLEYKELCTKNKRNRLSNPSVTISRGGCISSIEHRDKEEKFTKARAEEAARLGEGAVINDDYLWVKIMGIHKRRCYGLGNLITEMAVFPTRSQSSQSTSTMDIDQSSLKEEVAELCQLVQQQNKTQKLILVAL